MSIQTDKGDCVVLPFIVGDDLGKYLVVPARSESLHFIKTSITSDCVIHSQELCDGVFVANTIARPKNGKVPIKILNTRDDDVTLSKFILSTSNMNDYSI